MRQMSYGFSELRPSLSMYSSAFSIRYRSESQSIIRPYSLPEIDPWDTGVMFIMKVMKHHSMRVVPIGVYQLHPVVCVEIHISFRLKSNSTISKHNTPDEISNQFHRMRIFCDTYCSILPLQLAILLIDENPETVITLRFLTVTTCVAG